MTYRLIESCTICGPSGFTRHATLEEARAKLALHASGEKVAVPRNTVIEDTPDKFVQSGEGHVFSYVIEEKPTVKYYIEATETRTLYLVVEATDEEDAKRIASYRLGSSHYDEGVVMTTGTVEETYTQAMRLE